MNPVLEVGGRGIAAPYIVFHQIQLCCLGRVVEGTSLVSWRALAPSQVRILWAAPSYAREVLMVGRLFRKEETVGSIPTTGSTNNLI